MDNIQLSEKVSIRPANTYGHVKLFRIKDDGTERVVYFPSEWINQIILAHERILSNEDVCEYKNWRVEKGDHLGVEYIHLNFKDKTGDRIG